jgi:GSCFA family
MQTLTNALCRPASFFSFILFSLVTLATMRLMQSYRIQSGLLCKSRGFTRKVVTSVSSSNWNSNAQSYSTRVSIKPPNWMIDHSSSIHLVGSCFTDTISTALSNQKFDCFTNGQGISFNPVSIAGCLHNVVESELF